MSKTSISSITNLYNEEQTQQDSSWDELYSSDAHIGYALPLASEE